MHRMLTKGPSAARKVKTTLRKVLRFHGRFRESPAATEGPTAAWKVVEGPQAAQKVEAIIWKVPR